MDSRIYLGFNWVRNDYTFRVTNASGARKIQTLNDYVTELIKEGKYKEEEREEAAQKIITPYLLSSTTSGGYYLMPTEEVEIL